MKLLILYGTQSGTAQNYAELLAAQAYTRKVEYVVQSLANIDPSSLPSLATEYNILLFIVSTTGDGETPQNMTLFWRQLLQKSLPNDWLKGLRCAVLGLGDSSYEKFCFVGKRLYRRLASLSACLIAPRRDGDEQHALGQDFAFNQWSSDIFGYLNENYGISLDPIRKADPKVSLQLLSDSLCKEKDAERYKEKEKFILERNIRITPLDYWQDVRHLTFSTQDPLQYSPSDVAVIRPVNSLSDVNNLLQILNWMDMANTHLHLTANRPEVQVPTQCTTLTDLLLNHLDITAPPTRSFFKIMAIFAEDDFVREKLEELASPEGLDLYLDYVWRPRRRPIEVLEDFQNKHRAIPPENVLDLFPLLKSREYSIASCAASGKVELCVAMVKYKTILPETRWGVASRYFDDLKEGVPVTMHIRRGSWMLPSDASIPLCLFAAGTGISPIRSLIQQTALHTSTRPMYLFYGCRNVEADYHYGNEWPSYCGQLTVRVLGSRDEVGARRHVDHLIRDYAGLIGELVGRGAWIYIAGNAKLPSLVKKTLSEIGVDPSKCTIFIEAWS